MRGESKPPRLPPPQDFTGTGSRGGSRGAGSCPFPPAPFLSPRPEPVGRPPHHLRFTALGSQAAARGQAPQC